MRRLLLLGAALVGTLAVPAAAQTEPPPTVPGGPPPAPTLELVDRSPWVAPDREFSLDVSLSGPLGEATLQVVVREPLSSLEDLERSLDEDIGAVVYRSPDVGIGIVPVLASGARRITIDTSVGPAPPLAARLREPGVYPVEVRLEVAGALVDAVRTPMVRLGADDDPLAAPRLELVADVGVTPRVEPGGRRPLSERELARLARLGTVLGGTAPSLTGLPPVSLSIAALPDTVDALTASSDPRAAAVLGAIGRDGAERTLLGMPFVPLSATALVDADLDGVLGALTLSGRAALADRFGLDIDHSVWDGRHGIDDASGDVLADLDVEHVLVPAPRSADDSAVAERALVSRGPFPVNELDSIEVVLVDRDTSEALLARAADRVDSGHVALAELILRDAGAETAVVVRIDDAPEGSILLSLLPLLVRDGSPVPIGGLSLDDPGTGRLDPDADEPDDRDEIELPDGDLDLSSVAGRVRTATTAVGTFSSLVMGESARATELGLRIATSIAVGVDDQRRRALLDSVEAEVGRAFAGVSLTGQTDLNLTSRSGTLPLMIRNDNDFPVEVVLQIRSERLAFPDGDRFTIAAADEITRFDVPVRARATGSVPTFVEIRTPDGRILLDDRQLNVRSTAVSGVGLGISLAALAVLVVWWARTWRRSRRVEAPADGAAERAEAAEPAP